MGRGASMVEVHSVEMGGFAFPIKAPRCACVQLQGKRQLGKWSPGIALLSWLCWALAHRSVLFGVRARVPNAVAGLVLTLRCRDCIALHNRGSGKRRDSAQDSKQKMTRRTSPQVQTMPDDRPLTCLCRHTSRPDGSSYDLPRSPVTALCRAQQLAVS